MKTRYTWQGITRREVSGKLRQRLWRGAAEHSRMAPAAFVMRGMEEAARDRADYARSRNPFYRQMHLVFMDLNRRERARMVLPR